MISTMMRDLLLCISTAWTEYFKKVFVWFSTKLKAAEDCAKKNQFAFIARCFDITRT
jgi:hypothetical protein